MAAARRAVELEPQRARWRDRLATLLMEAGRLEEAEAALRQALARSIESGGMYFRLSRLLQGKRPEEALAVARRAVALEPQKPYLREHLVTLLMESGKDADAEAETALRAALERHPGDAALHFHQSRLLQRRRRPEQALAAARRAVELDPQRVRWRDHLTALLAEAGRLEEAQVVPARGTARPSVLQFPAARSGRDPDGVSTRTPDCLNPGARARQPSDRHRRRQGTVASSPSSARRKRSLR